MKDYFEFNLESRIVYTIAPLWVFQQFLIITKTQMQYHLKRAWSGIVYKILFKQTNFEWIYTKNKNIKCSSYD